MCYRDNDVPGCEFRGEIGLASKGPHISRIPVTPIATYSRQAPVELRTVRMHVPESGNQILSGSGP